MLDHRVYIEVCHEVHDVDSIDLGRLVYILLIACLNQTQKSQPFQSQILHVHSFHAMERTVCYSLKVS